MRDFVIVTDSSCDLPTEIVEQNDILVVPMGICFDGVGYKHYHDFRELNVRTFYDGMRDGKIGSTAGTNMLDAIDVMKPVLDDGKDIVFLSISSGLSCSYQNACLAAEELLEEYEDARIEVIDTKSVTLGVGIMACVAANMRVNGKTMDEVVAYLRNNCDKVYHVFAADDLAHLQRSGRISHISSIVGSALGIKPVFTIDANGKIQTIGKMRGRKAVIKHLIESAKNNCVEHEIFGICHADTPDDAEMIKEKLMEDYPGAKFIISNLGPIIGVNTGIGTLAIVGIGEKR